jgi:hypothetical protein
MRDLRERYRRPDAQLAPSSAGPRHARHAGHKLTPRSPARITVHQPRRSKAAATDGHRNLAIGILQAHGHRNIAAALRRNARDATRVLPLLGSTSP